MKVVLGVDGSETAAAAVRFLAAMPLPTDTEVVLLSVVDDVPRPEALEVPLPSRQRAALDEAAARAREEALTRLEPDVTLLREAGLAVTTEVRTGSPAAEILAAADEHGADLVVVGSHGRSGYRRFLLGSVSNRVLHQARRSVLVVRSPDHGCQGTHPEPPARTGHPWRVLVGFDGSAPSEAAVDFCARFELDEQASLRLVSVLPMVTVFRQDLRQELDPIWQQRKEAEKAALHAAADRLRQGRAEVTTSLTEAGDVSDALLAAGEEFGADLIVLGRTGRGGIERVIMGSVSSRVAHHACPAVLVVRSG